MIYPEVKGDYYPKSFSQAEFNQQCAIFQDPQAFVAYTEEGNFVALTLLERIAQIIKGLLGFSDHGNKARVQAAFLRFLYYGEAHGFLTNTQIHHLKQRIQYPSLADQDPLIKEIVKQLKTFHEGDENSKSHHLGKLREIVMDFHSKSYSALMPGFWIRLLKPASLPAKGTGHFGETPLKLFKKAIASDEKEGQNAFDFLKIAFEVKNDSVEFQQRLGKQLEKLEKHSTSHSQNRQLEFQMMWFELAQNAYANNLPSKGKEYLSHLTRGADLNSEMRLRIGKLYLLNKEFHLAEPFLEELKNQCGDHCEILKEVGHAYWELKQFPKAIEVYEKCVIAYKNQYYHLAPHEKQLALIHFRIGSFYLEKEEEIDLSNVEKAYFSLNLARFLNPSSLDAQLGCCRAFIQLKKLDLKKFADTYHQPFTAFLSQSSLEKLGGLSSQISDILLEMGAHFFEMHQSTNAHLYLSLICLIFKDHIDRKIAALDLAIQYHDWKPLEKHFKEWNSRHPTHPFLKMKIGDAYWQTSKEVAIPYYKEALVLFNKMYEKSDKPAYLNIIADLHAKIGEEHLHAKGKFDEAFKNLEAAASLNPEKHGPSFFASCLAAAEKEKKLNWLQRDENKMIEFYLRAYKSYPQNGPYLGDCISLLIEKKRVNEAVQLYVDIQKHPWANQLSMSPSVLNNLGQILIEKGLLDIALVCCKQAYASKSKKSDKKDYFQTALSLADQTLNQSNEGSLSEDQLHNINLALKRLEECWKEGFENVESLKKPMQEKFVLFYQLLAKQQMKAFLMPKPHSQYTYEELKKYRKEFKKEIFETLRHYGCGLEYRPESAELRFDKGALLEWLGLYEKALAEYELAAHHEPSNSFYHKCAESMLVALGKSDGDECLHAKAIAKNAPENLMADFLIWSRELMLKSKSKVINPHSYTVKKRLGFF